MTSVTVTNDQYTQVSTGTDYVLQNVGRNYVMIVGSDTQPPVDTIGFVLEPEVALKGTDVKGIAWAKAMGGESVVVVSE